ncbi:hypothetical protein J4214_05795 [Candidatus Woesearchaeota archaeon]|nr:hypothetical protein [Candidatus Woesearchaeota archaeon]
MTNCGLTELASCIPEKIFDFVLNLLNSPLQLLLDKIKNLLSEPINIEVFSGLWSLIVYIISIFYGLLFLYSGFQFIISGHDIYRREKAKQWIKNTILIIFFVQASYLFYSLLLEISSLLNAGTLNLIDQNFFLLTSDNLENTALEFILFTLYVITLSLTIIFLVLRYILVSIGIIFFPLGLFFNFIPFLENYGKLIINSLLILIFVTFPQSLILLAGSRLIEIPIFENYKILVMICSFILVNLLMIFLLVFAIIKGGTSILHSDTGRLTTTFYHPSRLIWSK